MKHRGKNTANISKEEHFLPSLVAKANFAPKTSETCDLWPVKDLYYLYFCRLFEKVSVQCQSWSVYKYLSFLFINKSQTNFESTNPYSFLLCSLLCIVLYVKNKKLEIRQIFTTPDIIKIN